MHAPAVDKIGRQGGQSVVVAVRPPVLNRDIAALDVSGIAKAFSKRLQIVRVAVGRSAAEEPDHRQSLLLRASCARPRRRPESRDELPPPCMSGKEHSEG